MTSEQQTSKEKLTVPVISGPSKYLLMTSLFDENKKNDRQTVDFVVGEGVILKVAITQVQREDGSGQSWNIEGRIVTADRRLAFDLEGYYTSKRKTGHLTLIAPYHEERKRSSEWFKVVDPEREREVEEFARMLRG